MTALTPAMRAALDEARAADPRPAVIAVWDEIEQLADASDDPAGSLAAYCEMFVAEADRIIAEQREEIIRIAAGLGAEIVEVDPANRPDGLKDTTVYGWYRKFPTPRLFFPVGQRVWERLAAARQIADSQRVTA